LNARKKSDVAVSCLLVERAKFAPHVTHKHQGSFVTGVLGAALAVAGLISRAGNLVNSAKLLGILENDRGPMKAAVVAPGCQRWEQGVTRGIM